MKLTKLKLKEIIREEINRVNEAKTAVVVTLPKDIYSGGEWVFKSEKEAEDFIENSIGSEAWHHVKVKKVPVSKLFKKK